MADLHELLDQRERVREKMFYIMGFHDAMKFQKKQIDSGNDVRISQLALLQNELEKINREIHDAGGSINDHNPDPETPKQ